MSLASCKDNCPVKSFMIILQKVTIKKMKNVFSKPDVLFLHFFNSFLCGSIGKGPNIRVLYYVGVGWNFKKIQENRILFYILLGRHTPIQPWSAVLRIQIRIRSDPNLFGLSQIQILGYKINIYVTIWC
jgi:hypothetical protein